MMSGSCPGAGKSSLATDLAAMFGSLGSSVLMISEDDVWGKRELGVDPVSYATALPEFSALMRDHRTPPTADAILQTFERVRERYLRDQTTWIQDWSWLDLASALLGRHRHAELMNTFAADLLDVARNLNPVVLYLRLDPEIGLERAARERGMIWLRRHAGVPANTEIRDGDLIRGLVDHYRGQESERLKFLGGSGWELLFVDADIDRPAVLSAAVVALGLKSA